MKLLRCLILMLCALEAGSAFAQSASQTLPKPYDELMRKSIFARNRVAWTPPPPATAPTPPPPPPPPPSPIFIGVVHEDAGSVAILEYPDSGRLVSLHPGDAMPENKGAVLAITLDYIEYAPSPDQPSTRLALGRNLEGNEAALPSPSGSAYASFPPSPSSQPSAPYPPRASYPPRAPYPSGPSATTAPMMGGDMISRMRMRRQQEMNR